VNNYPKWWDKTITIYNKFEDPQTRVVRWYRNVLNNCFWKNSFQRLKIGEVEVQTDSIICRIPPKNNFLTRPEWLNVPNDTKADYFTLAQGDIVILGEIEDNINEYESGHRSSDILNKYKAYGSMVIDRCNDNTGANLGIPHYHIEGV